MTRKLSYAYSWWITMFLNMVIQTVPVYIKFHFIVGVVQSILITAIVILIPNSSMICSFYFWYIYIFTHSHYPLSLSYFHVWWIWLRIYYYLLLLWNELIHVSTIYTYNYRYSSNNNNSHNGHINHMEVSQNIGTPKHGKVPIENKHCWMIVGVPLWLRNPP